MTFPYDEERQKHILGILLGGPALKWFPEHPGGDAEAVRRNN